MRCYTYSISFVHGMMPALVTLLGLMPALVLGLVSDNATSCLVRVPPCAAELDSLTPVVSQNALTAIGTSAFYHLVLSALVTTALLITALVLDKNALVELRSTVPSLEDHIVRGMRHYDHIEMFTSMAMA